jgi:hypothetical protein
MAVSFSKFNTFVKDLGDKVHDLDADTLKVYLTNATPAATNTVKANIAEITAQNGYPSGGTDAQGVWTESGGVGSLACTDIVFTASGGSFGPFRYAILYNDTPTSPADPLIGYYDYGSSISCNDGETLTVDFAATTLTIT